MTERASWARRPWIWPAVLALYAAWLVAAFGGEFLGAFLFVASAAGMTLPERFGPAGVTAATAAALLAALLAGVDGSRTAALLLTVFMVSIAVTWIRRMVALIRELRAAREQVARRMVRQDPAAAERELDQVGSLAQRSLAEVRAAVAGYGRSPWPVSWRAHGRRSAPPGSRARSGRGRARRYRECSVRMDDPRGRDECDPPQRRPPLRHHRARRRPSGCAPWGAGWRRAAPAAAASGWRRPSRTSDGRAGRAG